MWGLSEANLWTDWTAPLNSTSCRRFAIDLASLRRCDGEGSPCQRWGLGFSVSPNEWFSSSKRKIQFIQGNCSVHPREWLAFAERKVQHKLRSASVHPKPTWLLFIFYFSFFIFSYFAENPYICAKIYNHETNHLILLNNSTTRNNQYFSIFNDETI